MEKEPDVRKTYEQLRAKHKLPLFEELDTAFEISTIESDNFLLREIRRKITERLRDISGLVERLLQPEANLIDMYESKAYTEEEKAVIFEQYRRLIIADRLSIEAELSNDEKMDAAFISSISQEWKAMKPGLIAFVKRLRETWESEADDNEKAGYMG